VVGGVGSSELAAEALAAVAAAAAAEPLRKQFAHRAALVRCVHQAAACRALPKGSINVRWTGAVCGCMEHMPDVGCGYLRRS
jgi:hypothetical protein